MEVTGSVMLHEFISANRDEIIARCRAKVATRSVPPPSKAEIDHGVPMFLDQLVDELRVGLSPNLTITRTATTHGHDLLDQGFTVAQVVHDYGDVCQTITEMAVERTADISADDFRMLNRCLDDAIAGAVSQYTTEREQLIVGGSANPSAPTEVLVRELRIAIRTARLSLEAFRAGNVGITGSTGTLLQRSLMAADDVTERMLAQLYAPPPTAPTMPS
jgi:hypothetical protein